MPIAWCEWRLDDEYNSYRYLLVAKLKMLQLEAMTRETYLPTFPYSIISYKATEGYQSLFRQHAQRDDFCRRPMTT